MSNLNLNNNIKKQKKRINKACELCKKRKVKCDGKKPCANCVKYNHICIYPNTNLSLISQINNNQWEKESKDNNDYPSPFFSFSLDKYRFHRRYQNVLPYYLGGSLIKQLPRNIIKERGIERPRIQNYSWNMAGGQFLRLGLGPVHDKIWDFNNKQHIDLIKKLLIWFFKHCNPIFSIIHEPIFWSQFNNRFLSTTTSKHEQRSNKLFKSMLFLIIIISLRFNDGLILNGSQLINNNGNGTNLNEWEFNFLHQHKEMEQQLFNYSYNLIQKLTFEWESFELIQSWLLITFYLRTCYRQTSTWNALSRAITLVKGMSLEMNMFPLRHPNFDESKAIHCFWSCFIMDKVISFQIGRTYQLESSLNDMPTPRTMSLDDDWFHIETQQMYDLSLIIYKFQQNKCFEMDLYASKEFRQSLQSWYDNNQFNLGVKELSVMKLQPLMTYLDIKLNFELRSLFPLLDPPNNESKNKIDPDPPILPLDLPSLLTHCQLTMTILSRLCHEQLVFIPWWLTLSHFFQVTIIALTCSYLNLQTLAYRDILRQVIPLWDQILNSDPWNPPVMIKQCDWCIKTLNHMISLILQDTASSLQSIIGINHGDNTPNQNNFQQFSRVGEDEETDAQAQEPPSLDQSFTASFAGEIPSLGIPQIHDPAPIPHDNNSHKTSEDPGSTDSLLTDDLLANLHWFDENFL